MYHHIKRIFSSRLRQHICLSISTPNRRSIRLQVRISTVFIRVSKYINTNHIQFYSNNIWVLVLILFQLILHLLSRCHMNIFQSIQIILSIIFVSLIIHSIIWIYIARVSNCLFKPCIFKKKLKHFTILYF